MILRISPPFRGRFVVNQVPLVDFNMTDSGDPSGMGSRDGERSLSCSSTDEDPSDQEDPRHETVLGEDTGTDEPMEGVEAGGSTSPGPEQGMASAPLGELPAPGSEASSPLGELLNSKLVVSASQEELPAAMEVEMILSITASDKEEFLSAGEQVFQAGGTKAKSPERPDRDTKKPKIKSVVSRVSRRASPTRPPRRERRRSTRASPSPSPPPALRKSG